MAEEVKKILETNLDKSMEGMNITFPMAYHDRAWYGSWLRPKDALDSLSNRHIPPPVTLEQKRHWPVGTDDSEIPRKELLRQHHKVPDPNYTVPLSKKELLPPQPVYPQSRGIKLRDVDTISKDPKYLRPSETQLRKPQQSNFKKPEASSRQTSSAPTESTMASILHDICSASQPQPKPSTSSTSYNSASHTTTTTTTTRLPKSNRPSKSSSSNIKKSASSMTSSPAIKKSSSKSRTNVPSSTNNLSESETNYRNNNDTHPYTNLIKARSNLLNDDPLRNRALEDLRRAKEQVAAASKPNLPLHILTFDDYTYNILGDRDRERSETADKKRPLIEKTRSTTPERKKSRKTTGGKVVPPRPPTRELEEGETISPSPSPNVKRVREDEVSESRKKRPTSPRRSRSPRRASSPRRPRSPSRKARSDKSVSRSKTERRRSSLTRVEGTRKKYEHRDRDASVDSKSSSKKRRQKKGDELEDVFASAAALDQKRNNEQKEEKAKEERIKEEKMREEKLKEEKFKEEKLKEEKLKEEKLKEEKLKEEKLKEEKLKEEKLKEEKLKEEKLREEKLKEEKLREEKLKEEKLKEEKLREEKLKEEKLKEEKLREEKIREEKIREEKIREEKLKQDKLKEDKIKDEKSRDERSKDSRDERSSRESRPSSTRDRSDRKKRSSDESKRSSSSKSSSSRSKDAEKVSTPQLKSRSSSSASMTEKEALSRQSISSQKNSPSLSSKPSPAESNASKASTSSSTKAGPSATAPNAESPEQYRVFTLMFKKLAHYNKRQGDSGGAHPSGVTSLLDHLHSLANYVLSFYYLDKQIGEKQYKQSIASWQSLFPFADAVVRNLEAKNEPHLLAVAKRLVALARFHVFVRMESVLRPTITERLAHTDSTKNDNKHFQEVQTLMSCYDRAQRLMRDSEKVLNCASLQSLYPETFRKVCIEGDLSSGITLGGEAGVTVSPLYPFTPYTTQLNHAAIAAKCLLAEYVDKNNIKYEVITDVKDFM